MAQKRKTDQTKLIVKAALDLAGKSGWSGLTTKAVAKKARLKPDAVAAVFSDKWDILKYVLKDLELETDRAVKARLGDAWRDNLFEIMMTRLELAALHKKAFASLPDAFRKEPRAVVTFARTFWRTMAHMLKTASLPGSICQPAHVAAFGVLYASVIDAFLKDTTKDHSKTMAVLDQRLGWFQEFVEFSACRKD